jgi:hypothetical protein
MLRASVGIRAATFRGQWASRITEMKLIRGRVNAFIRGPYMLGAVAVAMIVVARAAWSAAVAPSLPGWDWLRHRNSVLIVYPSAWCGCGLNLVLDAAKEERVDAIVVTDASSSAITRIRSYQPGVHIVVSKAEVRHLGGSEFMPSFLRVQYGVVTRRAVGAIPQSVQFME